MKRRRFINYLKGIGGAGFMGMIPGVIYGRSLHDVLSGNTDEMDTYERNQNPENGKMVARISNYNGKPTVFVNGKPYFPMAFISYYPKQFRYKNMWDSGIKFFSLSITLGDGFIGAYRNGKVKMDKKGIWDAPDKIDFDLFDKSIKEILDVAPEAFIFPRIYCDSPGWWDSYHPAETSRTYDGLPQRQSFSSKIWRDETAEVLRKIVRHIDKSSYSDRIIGIHVAGGSTEEWCYNEWLGPVDYSLAGQRSFKKWLLKKYNNDKNLIVSLFNKTIDEISIPIPAEREKTAFGDFLDPQKSRIVIDYQTFRCEEIVESAEFLCKAVKEESSGNLITGVFYGYMFSRFVDHFALSVMLKSPYIDFISYPNGKNRTTTIGDSDLAFSVPLGSVQKANKLFYYEADTRTCLSKWISELRPDVDPYHEYDHERWLGPETMEKSVELLRSVFSRVICTGSTNWWFDLWGGWYDHDTFLHLFNEMQKIGDESINLPGASVAEVCVIVDEEAYLHFPSSYALYPSKTKTPYWIRKQMYQIEKIGAPYDLFLLEDLIDLDVSKYKMIIFLNTILLNQQERKRIRNKCMCDEKSLFWLYAPGLIKDDISVSNVSTFINMEMGYEEERSDSEVFITLPDQELSYTGDRLSPFLYVKSGADTVYGKLKDDYAVLGEKKEKNFINILACVPPVPWKVIQYFAMKSGVHIYSEYGDVVYANESYLSISAAKADKRQIHLPKKSHLTELLGSNNEYKRGKEHEIYFPEESCRFFRIYDK